MSSRSAARGRAAASSIRLTSRTSKAVATRRAKPSRCFLFCRGKRAAKSAPIAAAIVSIPHPHPPAAPNPQLAPQLHGRASALGNLMGGECEQHRLVDSECAHHLAVLSRRTHQDAEARALEDEPQDAKHERPGGDQREVV